MKKRKGKLADSLGRWSYEKKNVNNLLLKMKSAADDMNDILRGIEKKK